MEICKSKNRLGDKHPLTASQTFNTRIVREPQNKRPWISTLLWPKNRPGRPLCKGPTSIWSLFPAGTHKSVLVCLAPQNVYPWQAKGPDKPNILSRSASVGYVKLLCYSLPTAILPRFFQASGGEYPRCLLDGITGSITRP